MGLAQAAARVRFTQKIEYQVHTSKQGEILLENTQHDELIKRQGQITTLQRKVDRLKGADSPIDTKLNDRRDSKQVSNQLPYLLIIPNAPERIKSVDGMDAIDRYNAPVHRMLREFATFRGVDWKSSDCPVDLWIFSTKYSLVPARMCIRSYEQDLPSDVDQELQSRFRAMLRAMLKAISKQRTYAEVYLYLPESHRAALGSLEQFFSHTPITLGSGDNTEASLDQLEIWLEKAIAVATVDTPVAASLPSYEGDLKLRDAVGFSLAGSQHVFDGVITAIIDRRIAIQSHVFPHPVTVDRSQIHTKIEWRVVGGTETTTLSRC